MKKIVRESLNESMSYQDFFGKTVTHENAIQTKIRNFIVDIIMEERGISEKAFSSIDDVILEVKNMCEKNPEVYEEAESYNQKRRFNLLAEEIYEKYFNKTA